MRSQDQIKPSDTFTDHDGKSRSDVFGSRTYGGFLTKPSIALIRHGHWPDFVQWTGKSVH
jgi:hypothetical protein